MSGVDTDLPRGGYVQVMGTHCPPSTIHGTWDTRAYGRQAELRILLESFLVFHIFVLCNYGLLTQSLFFHCVKCLILPRKS